ncbi:MAG: hypothetical protein Q8R04_07155 [Nanoarchaeota archaeon]|nr:hypothetical protein [Nanoarchaeota archaeon]
MGEGKTDTGINNLILLLVSGRTFKTLEQIESDFVKHNIIKYSDPAEIL